MIARLLMRAAVRLWPPERHADECDCRACIVRIASGTPAAITAARRRRHAASTC